MKKILSAILILSIFITSISYALDIRTHRAINEHIGQNALNGFSLDVYLKKQLGIQNGINELFSYNSNSQEIWRWIRVGGEFEDAPPGINIPYVRSTNHFHDPLKDISQAGFSGIWDIPHFLSGDSAVLWSQRARNTQIPGGYYSWHDVRGYFYNALTASNKDTRNTNFAETFRGLGQLMHLVQDMSVPEHSRNAGHYLFPAYEERVLSLQTGTLSQRTIFNAALASPIFFKNEGLTTLRSAFPSAPAPTANLFDTNQYGGSNPEITRQYLTIVTTPTGTIGYDMIGLAEYPNANFLTSDTLFKGYTHPSLANTNYLSFANLPVTIVTTCGNINHNTLYISGYGKQKLAGLKYFAEEIAGSGQQEIQKLQFTLDDRCYDEYARDLLPHAVGYSAGLLNYFFRGDIEVVRTANGLKIKNMGTETMTSYMDPATGNTIGEIQVYYDTAANERRLLKNCSLTVPDC